MFNCPTQPRISSRFHNRNISTFSSVITRCYYSTISPSTIKQEEIQFGIYCRFYITIHLWHLFWTPCQHELPKMITKLPTINDDFCATISDSAPIDRPNRSHNWILLSRNDRFLSNDSISFENFKIHDISSQAVEIKGNELGLNLYEHCNKWIQCFLLLSNRSWIDVFQSHLFATARYSPILKTCTNTTIDSCKALWHVQYLFSRNITESGRWKQWGRTDETMLQIRRHFH